MGNRKGQKTPCKKAQSAVEFMIIVAFALFFLIGIIIAIEASRSSSVQTQRDKFMNQVALSIVDEINLAAGSTDGYARQFKVPGSTLGVEFNASIRNGDVYLASYDGKHALAYAVQNVSGDVVIGNNLIERINGTIYLNRV
jgi:hypothetical protein